MGDNSLRDDLSATFAAAREGETPPPDTTKDADGIPLPIDNELPLPAGMTKPAPSPSGNRDATGRFAASKTDQPPTKVTEAKPAEEAAPLGTQQTPPKTFAPPVGWSPTAKSEFDKLPQAVKESIAKREDEVNNGFKKLADYKGLDSFVEVAKRANTTLPEALQRYMATEDLLEKNPVQGLRWLCSTYGIDPRQLMGEAPQQGQGQTPPFDPRALEQAVRQQVEPVQRTLQNWQRQSIEQQIVSFASKPENRYFENVADQMAMLIGSGVTDLKEAYDQACWMNPEVRALLIKEQTAKDTEAQTARIKAAADQARRAGGSVAGGSGTPQGNAPQNLSLRDEISQAFYSRA